MQRHNDNIKKKVLEWIRYADSDLQYARVGLESSKIGLYHLVAYHSQQSVEKYLKAYLVFNSIDFPYTHNITSLLELIPNNDLVTELKAAEGLTYFAITTR